MKLWVFKQFQSLELGLQSKEPYEMSLKILHNEHLLLSNYNCNKTVNTYNISGMYCAIKAKIRTCRCIWPLKNISPGAYFRNFTVTV